MCFCLESACYKILLIRSSKSLNRCHKDASWKSLISKSWSKQEIVKSTGGIEVGAPKLTYQKLGQNWSVILIGDLRTDRPESPTFLQSRHFACARISGCRSGCMRTQICVCTQIFGCLFQNCLHEFITFSRYYGVISSLSWVEWTSLLKINK